MTFIDAFQRQVAANPDKLALTFLSTGQEARQVTYGQLGQRVRAIAWELGRAVGVGDRVILLYPPGIEFVEAFLACVFAGVVAVPAYPPVPSRMREGGPRLLAIFRSASPRAVLTPSAFRSYVELVTNQYEETQLLQWIHDDTVESRREARWTRPDVDETSLAFLQYTSGSTGSPKGAMVTHKNLLANTALIVRTGELDENAVVGHWLPSYHDMGLIGHLLAPLRAGSHVAFMSPLDFLTRPVRWLEAITRYRATACAAPNFAYDLCVRRVTDEEKSKLDLSSWKIAINGAEPISPATLTRFSEAFARCGFQTSAYRPCYGLAEATLIVAGAAAGPAPARFHVHRDELLKNHIVAVQEGDARATCLVASGKVIEPGSVTIVDPSTKLPLGVDAVGEIWVRGDSVVAGYWRDDEQTREAFDARLVDGTGPFLRTGDLGFLNGEMLVVTGRLKDLIIRHGVNYYPHDIERTAEAVRPVRHGGSAAFGVSVDDEERVVVVVELERRRTARPTTDGERRTSEEVDDPLSAGEVAPSLDVMITRIREAITAEHGLPVYDVVIVPPGAIARTSSGKKQRRQMRSSYMAGAIHALGSLRPARVAPDPTAQPAASIIGTA